VAAPSAQLRAGRYLGVLLAIMLILYALVFFTGSRRTPRLGLDLEGGTTVTLKAQTTNGKAPTKDSLEQARQIIDNRVNGLGVAEAEVVTQQPEEIVISVPGDNGDQAKTLGATALLRFRPVIAGPFGPNGNVATPTGSATPTGTATGSATPTGSTTPKPTGSAKATSTGTPSPAGRPLPPVEAAPTATPTGTAKPGAATATPTTTPTSTPTAAAAGDPTALYPGVTAEQAKLLADLDCSKPETAPDDPNKQIAACNQDGTAKLLLDKTIIEGTEIKDAAPVLDTAGLGGWQISLDFKSKGQTTWAQYTSQHNVTVNQNDPGNAVAFVLDGKVVSYPTIQGTINGQTSITGDFDQQSATDLANSLKYGALPLTFQQSQAQTISPTLGSDQLKAGLLAGGIGLALVIIYSLIYYRALGLVTIASLAISGLLTYACLVLLGRQLGVTLTLAGIAGFIVAVGITADSFVVFFERLKDEVREGRTMRSGVPRAWVRARRTILSADAVSFLAAAILYYLAAGAVKGFAFTLGLSTILDLVIVFLFTHPLVSIASRSRLFSSARYSGLGAVQESAAEHGLGSAAAQSAAAARAAARRNRLKES
jgi:preprotein translocase subunit SecD